MILVDTNVVLDVATSDQHWATWSVARLTELSLQHELAINEIVFAEVSVGYDRLEQVEELVTGLGLALHRTPPAALFLAGKAYDRYRKACMLDHFLGPGTTLENFRDGQYNEEGDFVDGTYEAEIEQNSNSLHVVLSRDGHVNTETGPRPVRVAKRVIMRPGSSTSLQPKCPSVRFTMAAYSSGCGGTSLVPR